jgi:hypothetical protein
MHAHARGTRGAMLAAINPDESWRSSSDVRRHRKRWPGSAAELYEFPRPFADEVTLALTALDCFARADTSARFHTGPARQAKGYVLPPPPSPTPPRVAINPDADKIPLPIRTVEEQRAALGFTWDTVPPLVPRKPREAS